MAEKKKAETDKDTTVRKKCGIVMPIAGFSGYPEEHWRDVKEIIIDAADMAGFDAELVSYRNETAVIHKTIIQNLYTNDIVVVDVSGRNPNVMFELGMRLAFDKPTIIIKDEKTDYSFDTAPIDHLGYPASLHYQSIKDFKEDLIQKIQATYSASQEKDYSSFLKNFGPFTVAKIDEKEVAPIEHILSQLKLYTDELKVSAQSVKSLSEPSGIAIINPKYIKGLYSDFKSTNPSKGFNAPPLLLLKGFRKYVSANYDISTANIVNTLSDGEILNYLNS